MEGRIGIRVKALVRFDPEFSPGNLVQEELRRGIGRIPRLSVIDQFDVAHYIQPDPIYEAKRAD